MEIVPQGASVDLTAPGPIGGTTPGAGTFTTLTATAAVALSPANANVVLSPTGTGVVTISPATAGTMNKVAIGGTTPLAGAFTTLSATGAITSTLATGTAPFTVASTTVVANLNASSLSGATFAAPGAIGGGTPAAGTFTTLADSLGSVRKIPHSGSDKVTGYTLLTSDVGQYVSLGTSGAITIPDATFAAGDVVSLFNNTTGNITITGTITTCYLAGTDADKATLTLATRGVATILFLSGTVCVVSGNVS